MGERLCVFKEKNANSVRVNRPLLEVAADKRNHHASTVLCLTEIECERGYMEGNSLKVYIPDKGFGRLHALKFYTSMTDEKFDCKAGGLAGAGSTYFRTLFDATRTKQDVSQAHLLYPEHFQK